LPKFALIQDGTETARQQRADVRECFERCCEALSDGRLTRFSFEVFPDEAVSGLLNSADPDEWDCLVFASNALLSGEVEEAITRLAPRLHDYLDKGGGLVVLHQQRDSLSPLLPEHFLPELSERSSKRENVFARPAEGAGEDVLLRYPAELDLASLRDLDKQNVAKLWAEGHAIDLKSLFFKVLGPTPLPRALKPVVTSSAGEVIVARSQDHLTAARGARACAAGPRASTWPARRRERWAP
jgi:hypothetical protein